MAKKDSKIIDKDKITRVSSKYTKDFKSRVESLQTSFTGKNRRKLYDTLLAKGVITKNYTVEMWNNDFKAWKINPNNGIFRYLEMVSAILDEANIPAFEVFGGPHARDTDEIIKSISSGIENYLENSLREFKDYKTKNKRTDQKRERTINGNTFKNMTKVHDEIAKHWGVNAKRYCIDKVSEKYFNPAFFFLYAWPDPEIDFKETTTEDLHNCIDMLVKKMINSKFSRYYFGYFFEPYDGKRFDPLFDYLRGPADHAFDSILNQALILTYQLNYIIHVYTFYYTGKSISITNRTERNPIIMKAENSSTGEEEPMDIAQFYNISDIDVKSVYLLMVNKLRQGSRKDEPKKILNQRLQEFKENFIGFVDFLCNDNTMPENFYFKLHDDNNKRYLLFFNNLEKNILFFQNVMEYLYPNHVSHSKYLFHEYIYIGKRNKKKMPMKYHKERIVFNIPVLILDGIDQAIICLKEITDILNGNRSISSIDDSLSELSQRDPYKGCK